MKKQLTAAFAALALLANPAGATPQSPDYTNGGQCAGDSYSKCRYTLEIVNRAVDNGLMVSVPNVGLSRVESLNYCLKDVGVDKYQDLITDSDFVNFERCMVDLT
jgi:hypothetical protein